VEQQGRTFVARRKPAPHGEAKARAPGYTVVEGSRRSDDGCSRADCARGTVAAAIHEREETRIDNGAGRKQQTTKQEKERGEEAAGGDPPSLRFVGAAWPAAPF
jgi:hypothetical protein